MATYSSPPNHTYQLSDNELQDPEKLYCDDCKHMIKSWPWEEEKHQAVAALKLEKCPLCKFLLEKLELEKRVFPWDHDKLITLQSWADEDDPHADITSLRGPITNINGSVMGHARSWLQECSTKHRACKRMFGDFLAQPVKLPSRILRLDEKDGFIRIQKPGSSQKGIYATLSYVWGKKKQVAIENPFGGSRAEIDERGWIATTTLPVAFRDAIELAIKLGLKFLWIHALCVPRDDSNAQKQAKTDLFSIYKHSVVCIRLGNIDTVHQSFLRKEGPHMPYTACVVRVTGLDKGEITVKLTTKDRCHENGLVRHEGSLHCRAWATGEAFSSPRHITITAHNEMTYWCIEQATRGQLLHCPVGTQNNSINRYQYSNMRSFFLRFGAPDEIYQIRMWNRLVLDIHRSEPSQPEDRFFIVDGIARYPMWSLGDYNFGLWRRDVRRQLLWKPTLNPCLGDTRRWNQAPTWSWASTSATVNYFDTQDMRTWQFRFLDWGPTKSLVPSRVAQKGGFAIKLQGKITSLERLVHECGGDDLALWRHMVDCSEEFDQFDAKELFVFLAGQVRYKELSNRTVSASEGTTTPAVLENSPSNPENSDNSTTKNTAGNAEKMSVNNMDNKGSQEQPNGSQRDARETFSPIDGQSNQYQPESKREMRDNRGFSGWAEGFPRALGTLKHKFGPTRKRVSGFASNLGHQFSASSLGIASAPQKNSLRHETRPESNTASFSNNDQEGVVDDAYKYVFSEDVPFNPPQLAMQDKVTMIILRQVSKNVYERVGLFSVLCRSEWIPYWNEVNMSEFFIV